MSEQSRSERVSHDALLFIGYFTHSGWFTSPVNIWISWLYEPVKLLGKYLSSEKCLFLKKIRNRKLMTIYNIANDGTHKYATISIIMLTAFDITTFGLSPPWLSKPRADFTRSPNEGYQRTDVFQIIFFMKGEKRISFFCFKINVDTDVF